MKLFSPVCFSLAAAALILSGCSGGAEGEGEKVKVYPVKGKITMAGAPVAGASVTFSPVTAKGESKPAAFGKTNTNGEYTLRTYEPGDGAAPGSYKVMVSISNVSSSSGPVSHEEYQAGGSPAAHAAPGKKGGDDSSVLPAKYASAESTDLNAKVEEKDDNEFNFDLKP